MCLSLLCSCGTKELPIDQLVERQGIYYEINSEVPYTGRVTDTHQNGQISTTGSYKDGKQDGPWEIYHENGQLERKGSYKDDEIDGPLETYYPNGNLMMRILYKNGKQDGSMEGYNEDGERIW